MHHEPYRTARRKFKESAINHSVLLHGGQILRGQMRVNLLAGWLVDLLAFRCSCQCHEINHT